jgi:hypothetical protein
MAGVVVGASAGGILGAFMAAPVIATGRILFEYAYNKLAGRPPFPSDEMISPALHEKESDEPPFISSLIDKLSGLLGRLKRSGASLSDSNNAASERPTEGEERASAGGSTQSPGS